jgi:hypothetical protein
MPADTSLVDAALLSRLAADAPLVALMPDGIYFDQAKQGALQFVIVSLLDGAYEGVYVAGRAIYSALYLVKAVSKGMSNIAASQAAARLDALLEDQPLTVAGWNGMSCFCEVRLRTTEVDIVDPGIRWQHWGGHFRIEMSVVGA